jgi:hypothetical protein
VGEVISRSDLLHPSPFCKHGVSGSKSYNLIWGRPMPRNCIFCSTPLKGVRSEEHAIPRWLMEYLGITDPQLYLAIAHSQDDSILKDRKHVAGNFVEGRVCGGCNNGWMRDLEEQTRELLKPLIEGNLNLLNISDDERVELAKRATKTAFVFSHAAPLQKVPPLDQMRYI